MNWYVVRYTVKGYKETMNSLTQAPCISTAVINATKQLEDRGIAPIIVGAYLDDTPTPLGPHPYNEGTTDSDPAPTTIE